MNLNCFEEKVLQIIFLSIIASSIILAWNIYSAKNPKPIAKENKIESEQKNQPKENNAPPKTVNKVNEIPTNNLKQEVSKFSNVENSSGIDEKIQLYAPVPQSYEETSTTQEINLKNELFDTNSNDTNVESQNVGELENELF